MKTNNAFSEFEDRIKTAQNNYMSVKKEMLALLRKAHATEHEAQDQLTEFHAKGVAYFDLMQRSINEYSFFKYFFNTNVRNSKLDDAISISDIIIKHWTAINIYGQVYKTIIPPKPEDNAYNSLQAFISEFRPEEAKRLKQAFKENNLPTKGYKLERKFIDMTKKQQIKFGAITGLILLLLLLGLTIFIECPTSFQSTTFTTVLALAAAAFSMIITGFININYKKMITAGGALAVFAIVFFLKPASLSDLKGCNDKSISGTIYYGKNTMEGVSVLFPKQNKSTTSDNFGNFNLSFNPSAVNDSLKIQLKKPDIGADSLYTYSKTQTSKSLDIYITKHCVECTAKDSTGIIVNKAEKCSADKDVILDFKNQYKKEGLEQKRTIECLEKNN